jgi:enolase-phosphatase E1
MAGYVRENFNDLKGEIAELETEYRRDFAEKVYDRDFRASDARSVADYLNFLIETDRKSTPLKTIQGRIWQSGYESGELRSEMFEDVPRAFERWRALGKRLAVYSSGSVLAQKLIFKYSNFGDLTPFIAGYFDTRTGGKKEAASYGKIAGELGFKAEEILFVSDVGEELDAARESHLQTALAVRPGNAQLREDTTHRIVESFDELEQNGA